MADEINPDKPARKSASERLDEVHQRAMRRFDAIWNVVKDERTQNLDDRRFATIRGAQWEGQYAYGQDEDDEDFNKGLPRMEVNKVGKSLIRLYSEYRSNRVTVDFRERGQASDKSSANALDGLYRADENDSPGGGQAAYDNAYDEKVAGGFGAWRLRAEFEDETDEKNDKQRIRIEPIYDADQRVFFDLDAQHQDKSDARFGFLLTPMSRDAFEEEYPKASPATFGGKLTWQYDWVQTDTITLAEYYEVEDGSVTRVTFKQIGTDEEQTFDEATLDELRDDGTTLRDELASTGWDEVRSRKIKRQRVHKYRLSGAECLKDEKYIAGPNIPIVPDYGKRWYIDGIERSMGHVRLAIDPSRIYNLMTSSLAEAAGASPFERPIFDPEQVQGLEESWARAHIDRAPYSLARVLYGPEGQPIQIGPISSVKPPQVAPNVAALIQIAGADIADLTGESEQAEDVPANTSAQAIELVHDKADLRTFIYTDNHRKAMKRSGEIWLGMAKELYVETGREMIAVDPEGGQSKVTLGDPALDSQGGQIALNDLSAGHYEVIVDVGPASRTRRDATVRNMFGVAQTAATIGANDTAQAALGVAIINMDGEGLDGIRAMERRKGVAGGWVEPTEEEAEQMKQAQANQQPDPQQQLIAAATAQAQAEAALAQSRTGETEAKAEQARAKTAEILAGIDADKRDQLLKAIELAMKAGDQQRTNTMEVPNGYPAQG